MRKLIEKAQAEKPQNRRSRQFKFRTEVPEVANYIARVVILMHMDYERAVETIEPNLKPEDVDRIAKELQHASLVQDAIEKQLKATGLDEGSKDVFVKEIWNRFWNGGAKEKEISSRILAKAFIAEKVDHNKPQELQIRGFKEGVAVLTGETPMPDNWDEGPETDPLGDALD